MVMLYLVTTIYLKVSLSYAYLSGSGSYLFYFYPFAGKCHDVLFSIDK